MERNGRDLGVLQKALTIADMSPEIHLNWLGEPQVSSS